MKYLLELQQHAESYIANCIDDFIIAKVIEHFQKRLCPNALEGV